MLSERAENLEDKFSETWNDETTFDTGSKYCPCRQLDVSGVKQVPEKSSYPVEHKVHSVKAENKSL